MSNVNSSIEIRQQILEEINRLDGEQLDTVLNFLHSLKSSFLSEKKTIEDDKIMDPLADFIGAVDTGNLSSNIDRDLYG